MTAASEDAHEFLPLSPPVLHILLTLGTRSLHGYAIMQELREGTEGRETLLPGTLYASIARMVNQGLAEETPSPEGTSSGGPRRRYYRCTEFGRRVARAELERLGGLIELGRSNLLLPEESGS